MASHSPITWVPLFCLLSFLLSLSFAARDTPNSLYKAVNLGGWLVTEGWIKPSLFDGIANKDLLDGTKIQLKSVTQGKYLEAESGGGTIIVAKRTNPSGRGWEGFSLWRINQTSFQMRVNHGQFIGVDKQGQGVDLVAVSKTPCRWETFEIVRKSDCLNRVRIKAPNGFFVRVKTEELVTADFAGNSSWGDNDPSVFEMQIAWTLQGEFQITNGYGQEKATQVLREHWKSFIVEDDFKFVSQNGLNAVRIPVGWWIASDPTPWPFVGGSLETLDNAFSWAEKYNLKVIVDLHAAPGSQNGAEHSGSRDGFLEWGKTDENIQQTVNVIDFLTARYAKSPSLIAVELINEPHSSGVPLDKLTKYYKAGYDVVRKHSSTAYVIMSNRQGSDVDPKELFPLASGRTRTAIDVHYYNVLSSIFDNMTVQDNINFINTNRSSELNNITTSIGPETFVGEWVAEWQVQRAAKEDYQRFAKAQLEVYGRASFGWAYWTLKTVNKCKNHWSLEWMIKNNHITL